MKYYEQKLQAVRQLMEDMPFGPYVKTPKAESAHFRKLFPLPFHCIADGVPRLIDITFKEFEELAPIAQAEKSRLHNKKILLN